MTNILGISGSLRKASFNAALLRAAVKVAPDNVRLDTASIRGIPLYDADVEADSGIPETVSTLKDRVAACDGLLLVTPEYNNSIPGVFKNAIDWLSRPSGDIQRVFGDRPVAVIGASPGGFGTTLSQAAWLPVLRYLGTRPWFGARMLVSRVGGLVDEHGEIADQPTLQHLAEFLVGFAAFAEQSRRA